MKKKKMEKIMIKNERLVLIDFSDKKPFSPLYKSNDIGAARRPTSVFEFN